MEADRLVARLEAALGPGGVVADAGAWRPSPFPGLPPRRALAVARPGSLDETCAVLRLCDEARQAIVVAGGLTGLTHATDTDGSELILSLERMASIREIDADARVAVAEAGVPIQALQEAAEARGLFYPVDWGARGSATVGGSLSTNAGGNRVIRFGMTRDRVLGVEAALADGTPIRALSKLVKNNAGYDLKSLLIGSEGTLGVVTAASFRLVERPASRCVAFAAVPDFARVSALLRLVDRQLGGLLSAYEVLWADAYGVLVGPARPPVAAGEGFAVLAEAMGGDDEADSARFETVLAEAMESGLATDVAVARGDRDAAAFWAIRDAVLNFAAFRPLMTFDVSLPVGAMEAYVRGVRDALATRFPEGRLFVFGHLGDGNLHLLAAPGEGAARAEIEALVYRPLAAIGGSISAEHGIGIEKRGWLGLTRSPDEIATMRRLKAALDPNGILNPGRVLAP
jgi:FAD/FMN-containing dehydrogenase